MTRHDEAKNTTPTHSTPLGGSILKQRTTLITIVAAGLLAASAVGATAQSEEPGAMDPAFFTGVIDHDGAENPSWAEGMTPYATCGPDGPPLNPVADDLSVGSTIETTDQSA